MSLRQTVPLLWVRDVVQSREFYCGGLGFSCTQTWEPDGRLQWCWLEQGGAAVMLQQRSAHATTSESATSFALYFLCHDAAAVYREITARGVSATTPAVAFYGMLQTIVTDPDGYELCFENPTG